MRYYVVATHLPDYLYCVSFPRYRPLNVPLSCEIDRKVVLGPRFLGQRILQILDMHFKIALTF